MENISEQNSNKITENKVIERVVEKVNPFQLGQKLVEYGVIKHDELHEALKMKMDGEKIGETLIRLGFCSEDDVFQTMAKRSNTPYLKMEDIVIDKKIIKLLSYPVINEHKVIPIFKNGDKIVVIMNNPLDLKVINICENLLKSKIIPVIVSDSTLKKLHKEIFSIDENSKGTKNYCILDNIDVVQYLDKLLIFAIENNVSDIHVDPRFEYVTIRLRIDGVLFDHEHVSTKVGLSLISRIKVIAEMDIASRRIPQDGRHTYEHNKIKVDMRMASVPIGDCEKMTIRVINSVKTHISIEGLGITDPEMLADFKRLYSLPYGFIIATGPTGSGKSTTLHALLAKTNYTEKQVITLEDPVEIKLDGINQIAINNKLGLDFTAGLRSILRSDPDIIMVGEVRDVETAKIAINSSMTGHLIFTSMHANESFDAPIRLLEMGINSYILASSLVAILSQRLIRKLCPECKEAYEISDSDLKLLCNDFPKNLIKENNIFYKPCGCEKCNYKGYKGRIGVFELLKINSEVKQCILNKQSSGDIREAAVSSGMKTLKYNGYAKVINGETSIEEVIKMII